MGYKVHFSNTPDIVICGSILGLNSNISNNTKIWGVGFNNRKQFTHLKNMNLFYAVRGKLTLNKLDFNSNIAIGDPGLLLSLFFKPKTQKKYDICIISHFSDYKYFKRNYRRKYYIINMATNNIERLANKINKCNFIFSSSLHGIIFSHSLGIPAIHLEYIHLISKNYFKYRDYYSVLDIPYIKEDLKKTNLEFLIRKYKRNRFKFLPKRSIIKQIQDNLLFSFPYQKMNNVICTTIKNEKKELNNWCNYHLNLGFDNIYIFYNNSKSNYKICNLIDDKIKKKVHILFINNKKISKNILYNNFYNKFKLNFKWCAFFDLNEYIVLYKWNNITQFLNQQLLNNIFIINLKKKNSIFGNHLIMKIEHKIFNYNQIKNIFLKKFEKLIVKGKFYEN